MVGGQRPETNENTGEIILSEEEIKQSSKAVAAFLSSTIGSIYGDKAGPNIARGFFNLDKKLEEHLQGFPGANEDLVEQVLEETAAKLKEGA